MARRRRRIGSRTPRRSVLNNLVVRGGARFDVLPVAVGFPLVAAKEYSALVTQDLVAAPVSQVLRNTFGGEPVWSRDGVGIYRLTLAGAFREGQTVVVGGPSLAGYSPTSLVMAVATWNSANDIVLKTWIGDGENWVRADQCVPLPSPDDPLEFVLRVFVMEA
jgi:hypothetical protein